MTEEIQPHDEAIVDSSKLFNIRVWEGIQYKFAKDLGIGIKVISEDGKINTPESNFSDLYSVITSTEKGRKLADVDIKKLIKRKNL